MTLLFFDHNGLVSVIHNQEHKYPTRDAQRKACQRLGRERQRSGLRLLRERRGVPQAAQPHQHRLSASHRQQAPKLVPTVLAYPHSVLPLYGVTLCSEGQVLSGAKHMQPLWRAHVNPHRASHQCCAEVSRCHQGTCPASFHWSSEVGLGHFCQALQAPKEKVPFKNEPHVPAAYKKNSAALRLPFTVKITHHVLLCWSRKFRYTWKLPEPFTDGWVIACPCTAV